MALVAGFFLAVACAGQAGLDDDGQGDATGNAASESESEADGEAPRLGPCAQYIECVMDVAPGSVSGVVATYGEQGSCWELPGVQEEHCWSDCRGQMSVLRDLHPDAESCWECSSDDDCPEDEPVCGVVAHECQPDGSNEGASTFLMAVSLSLAPSTPLQYLTSAEVQNGELSLALQPLTLDVGSTTEPRTPHGDPIVVPPILVVGQSFNFALDNLNVAGATNPITGSDLVASFEFQGTFVNSTMLCGTVAGQITAPLAADLEGSTFAAVVVEDGPLPTAFPIACP
jgi:hypothetical protein